jgi:hypothetical protein
MATHILDGMFFLGILAGCSSSTSPSDGGGGGGGGGRVEVVEVVKAAEAAAPTRRSRSATTSSIQRLTRWLPERDIHLGDLRRAVTRWSGTAGRGR